MARLVIETADGLRLSRDAFDYYGIYNLMLRVGYEHGTAEDLASWAENAHIGSEYTLDDYAFARITN